MSTDLFAAILVISGITFALRALPFIFKKRIENNHFLGYIKNKLPIMIMIILVFYSANFQQSIHQFNFNGATEKLAAIFVTALSHLIFKNYLVSIFMGTICYILLLKLT